MFDFLKLSTSSLERLLSHPQAEGHNELPCSYSELQSSSLSRCLHRGSARSYQNQTSVVRRSYAPVLVALREKSYPQFLQLFRERRGKYPWPEGSNFLFVPQRRREHGAFTTGDTAHSLELCWSNRPRTFTVLCAQLNAKLIDFLIFLLRLI